MLDPLSEFCKTAADGSADTAEGYVAFSTKDKVSRLRIRRASAPTHAPGYPYLLDVVYDGPYGTSIVLVYTFLMVVVRGRNLQPLIPALEGGVTDFIQEFDPEIWRKPTEEKATLIESIQVVVQESGLSVSGAETTGTRKQ